MAGKPRGDSKPRQRRAPKPPSPTEAMYREFYAVLRSRPGASLDERDALLRDLAAKHGVTLPERPAITDLDRAQDILFRRLGDDGASAIRSGQEGS